MSVSANTLFHFTKSSNLIQILLSKGLLAQYSDEHFEGIFPNKSIFRFNYIPMVSFCDLTIMQLSGDSKHCDKFGEYGVGLTKSWGIINRVSPVTYVHKKSSSVIQLNQLFKILNEFPSNNLFDSGLRNIKRELVDSIKYFKSYQGRWHKGNKLDDGLPDIIYYNEREWRYCPQLKEYQVLSAIQSYNKSKKETLNCELRSKPLKFEPEDIKFILIKEKKEKNEFIDVIRKMKTKTHQQDKLITNIISFEEIREDYG
jgi:hypothetical protein